jgi:hypothetical protein
MVSSALSAIIRIGALAAVDSRPRGWEGITMNARMLAVALVLAAFASAGPARAGDDGTAEQQRDCMNDAMTYCSQYIFAPDRNTRIGTCLWQYRAQISRACYAHLRPTRR